MATLLYTIFSFTAGASLHCAVRREISPCTCSPHHTFANTIIVTCEKMESFSHVVDVLQDKFTPDFQIWLKITHSQLLDFDERRFAEMNINIKDLRLYHNNLSTLPITSFQNLTKVDFLAVADNSIQEIPREMFEFMSNLGTLDFGRNKIKSIRSDDFARLKNLKVVVLASNEIELLEKDCFPKSLLNLHIGRNKISSLNGALRNLNDIKMLFINANNLTSLEEELPENAPHLMMLMASNNHLEKLPKTFKNFVALDTCYVNNNNLRSLDRLFSHRNSLIRLYAEHNMIEYLAEDEFLKSENIDEINLNSNLITSLNKSLLYITNLRSVNLGRNQLREFSMQEIYKLMKLRYLTLSDNRIEKLTGRHENIAEIPSLTLLYNLLLDNNLLKSLDGALAGLGNLRRLILSNNLLENIYAEDFSRMEELEILDLSNNRLKSLEAFSMAYLPTLETLNASYNLLTTMEKDFHGLPVMCTADLSHNKIASMTTDLVSNTRCSNHGVVNKLEIFLQENPVLCDENLPQLVAMFEMYYARLMGIAHCIVPQLLPLPANPQSSLIQQPPIELLASIMNPNQQLPLGGNQMPSIVQIIVPAQSLQHPLTNDKQNNTEELVISTSTTISSISVETTSEGMMNDTFMSSTTLSYEDSSSVEPLRSSIPFSQSTTNLPEPDKDDEIDDIQLNEDLDNSEDYQENEEKVKKQRDRSDFRYVESFESEKSILQKFEPDPIENDTELKNIINENYQPSVLPVPKALSSSKNSENDNEELQEHQQQDQQLEELNEQNINAPEV
ncbi:CLUMA_CG021345, isoform A [Clunio marinus]|uniref:CLUMA_CG021345, isoform A n=1 Tax=Clunio marinus TaxID=568069 RepID=A0A1J1J9Y7_9DIPT|nr:CLUMA_CG021345, isoform A [Clunio marinus]